MEDPDDVLAEVKERGHYVIYANVEKVATKGVSKGSRVLIITESTLFVYHKKSKKQQCALSYLDLNEISCKNTRLTLDFGDNFAKIDSQNVQKVLKKLKLAISHFLTEAELEKFEIDKPETQASFPILMRLHKFLEIRDVHLDHSTISLFHKAILYQYPRLAVPEGNPEAVRVFLRILPLCTFLVEVHFPEFEFTDQELEWLIQCTHLKYVAFTGTVDFTILEFLKTINLCTCSFSKSDMSTEDLDAIKEVPCVANGFHRAFNFTTFQYFTSTYLPARHIAVLNMDSTPNLNVRLLLQSLSEVVLLSMASCNLEVSNTIHDLELFELKKLGYLNLSGNRCNLKVRDDVKLPPSLFNLTVANVQWGDNCLLSFFAMVFNNFPNGVRLSVSEAEATHAEWDQVASLFGTIEETRFVSLSWTRNPITPQFLQLLQRSPSIEHLSVTRCFSYLEWKTILRFAKCLRNLSNLKYFCLRGAKTHFVGPYLYLILAALRRCPVEIVDIRNSGCGDSCMDRLKHFIMDHPTLKIIDFEGVVPTNHEKFASFLHEIHNKPGFKFSYPENDINKITDENLASSIKGLLVLDPDNHVGKPFHVYKFIEEPIFPRVLSHRLMCELTSEDPPNPEKVHNIDDISRIDLIPPILRPCQSQVEVTGEDELDMEVSDGENKTA